MTTTNPNEVPKYHATPELLDAIYARTAEQAQARIDAEQRAREWPRDVDRLLVKLAHTVAAHEERIAALEARAGVGRG